MFNTESYELGSKRSVIRELFEYGKEYAKIHGADSLFDFSLGNPSIPAPNCVNEAITEIIRNEPSVLVHGYTSAQGDFSARKAISDSINRRFGASLSPDGIYITCGAAASVAITLKAVCERADDEVMVFAPYFPEYDVFIKNGGAIPVAVAPDENFLPDFEDFEKKLSEKTRAVIINSPVNPSGAVYDEATIKKICAALSKANEKYGRKIIVVCDEPYREIVYDGKTVPYIMNYYDDAVVCYSFSKSLSLPGERIGYIAVGPKCSEERRLYAAICGASRGMGYVCAPSLMQAVISRCVDAKTDISAYEKNRDLLCGVLEGIGYSFVKPDGAFYLMLKSPEADACAFSERAKKYGLLLVPSDGFGIKGYVRVAFCVDGEMIKKSAAAFAALFDSYKNQCVAQDLPRT
ncbi:MAG: pyridoxal phosphate-dependent aminotransferase [Christensenellales bacterium]